jgi:hypothetical protein
MRSFSQVNDVRVFATKWPVRKGASKRRRSTMISAREAECVSLRISAAFSGFKGSRLAQSSGRYGRVLGSSVQDRATMNTSARGAGRCRRIKRPTQDASDLSMVKVDDADRRYVDVEVAAPVVPRSPQAA